jgi:hypothetical protein
MVLPHNSVLSFRTKQPDAFSFSLAPARLKGCEVRNLSSILELNTADPTEHAHV